MAKKYKPLFPKKAARIPSLRTRANGRLIETALYGALGIALIGAVANK